MVNVRVSKSERVLELSTTLSVEESVITFAAFDEDLNSPTTVIILTKDDFVSFGSPRKITVTIQPGDLLNDGEY